MFKQYIIQFGWVYNRILKIINAPLKCIKKYKTVYKKTSCIDLQNIKVKLFLNILQLKKYTTYNYNNKKARFI